MRPIAAKPKMSWSGTIGEMRTSWGDLQNI
jgi:hypothetical protein